jgi:osmotically-inducible protein OsmY
MTRRIRFWTRLAGVSALALALAGPAAAAPDAWITTKVKMALITSENAPARRVDVDTVDGRVTLHGSVFSAAEKAAAEKAARSVQGVREVRNLLQVVPAEAMPTVADEKISEQVTAALASDPALEDSDVAVASVNDGVVLLSGKAKTLSDHQRALEDASNVPGVKRVASEIESPDELADAEIWREGEHDAAHAERSSASDLWITSAAKLRLMMNDATPALDINVDTRDGIVTLFGMVPTSGAKTAAAAEVQKVDGVKQVKNELQVVPESGQAAVKQNDDQIEAAIEERLKARSELSDASIEVDVQNGVARLTGTVDNQAERLTALTVARATAGVRSINDALELRNPQVGAR